MIANREPSENSDIAQPTSYNHERARSTDCGSGRESRPVGNALLAAPCARSDSGLMMAGGPDWRSAMALRIICVCGFVIQGDNEDEFWRNAQSHMSVLHPELVESVTRDDLLAQAELL